MAKRNKISQCGWCGHPRTDLPDCGRGVHYIKMKPKTKDFFKCMNCLKSFATIEERDKHICEASKT
ncbi:MAG: hypothetical protein AABY22_03095 [Nanoarchaeota archaeon]